MLLRKLIFLLSTLLLALCISCTGSYELDFRSLPQVKAISLEGNFCTKEATSETAPIKIIFIVDTSGSMADTDPDDLRRDGVLNVIDSYYPYPNLFFAAEKFSGDGIEILTGGFTRDSAKLSESALNDLGDDGGVTPTAAAINLAKETILADIAAIDDDLIKERTKYIAILFSDGMPFYDKNDSPPDFYQDWNLVKAEVIEAAVDLMSIKESSGISDLILHSAFLGGVDHFDDDATYNSRYGLSESESFAEAVSLMQDIASTGSGIYTHFQQADQIDFIKIVSDTLATPYTIEDIIVSNPNSKIVENVFDRMDQDIIVTSDSDGDGLSDLEEEVYKTSPIKIDTDGDGISDFTEILKGMDPRSKDYSCSLDKKLDRDGDGVLDCEELLIGTNYLTYDTDRDLLPDGMEIFNGLAPDDPDDAKADADKDGTDNYEEIRKHTNPSLTDTDLHETLGYQYSWVKSETTASGYSCYNINIGNIGISETLRLEGEASPYNRVDVLILQTATVNGKTSKLLSKGSFKIEFDKPEDVEGNTYRIEDITFSNY